MLTLITAMAYAAHILAADTYVKGEMDPYVLSFQQFLFVGVLSVISGLIFRLPFLTASSATLWVIFFLAVFPTLLAFVVQLVAQRFTSPIKVSLIFALEPVFAAIFAWTYVGEAFILANAIGGLVIFIAMILAELPVEKLNFRNNSARSAI